VSAEELLRKYLQQRREMGEDDLVLDTLGVDEVLSLLGARRRRRMGDDASFAPGASAHAEDAADWRRALRAAESASAAPPRRERVVAPASPTSSTPAPPAQRAAAAPAREEREAAPDVPMPPLGLVVGTGERQLFGGPIERAESIAELADLIKECTRCRLHAEATNPVPGEGSPRARLVCVGEAPGANEDATGRPFVGQAGQLLTKILAAINLSRDEVFICNVLKHRPPGNRNPMPDEVTACRPYLIRQLEVIRPAVIVAFGTFAAQTLLETKLAITKLRGQVHRYHGIPVIVTYHPAALLRNPNWKRPTWEDVRLARRILDSAGA